MDSFLWLVIQKIKRLFSHRQINANLLFEVETSKKQLSQTVFDTAKLIFSKNSTENTFYFLSINPTLL